MNIAIIGCGYVADLYLTTLQRHQNLTLVGAWDCEPSHLDTFCKSWSVRPYSSFSDLLSDSAVETVLNLTNPRRHFEITKHCLEGEKHVYSEKPLAMDSREAVALVRLAEANGLYLSAAPCSLLGPTAQTLWKAIVEGAVGRVRLVYANFDDGLIAPTQAPWHWRNRRGIPWPAQDEFEIGCTYEHAGYVLTWLAAFFGPARRVTSFASCQIPDKGITVEKMAPDFSTGCIEYDNDIVARVTCGLVAPADKSLTIVGDTGVLVVDNVRDETCPVYCRRIPANRMQARVERLMNSCRAWLQAHLRTIIWSGKPWHFQHKYKFACTPLGRYQGAHKAADFCRGPAELADAIEQKRACRLSSHLGLHVTEVIEALQYPERFSGRRQIQSTFEPIKPLAWNP